MKGILARIRSAMVIAVAASALMSPATIVAHKAAMPVAITAQSSGEGEAAAAVRRAEERRFHALLAGDVPALRDMLAADFTYTHSTGVVQDLETYLAPIASGHIRYTVAQGTELRVRIYGTSTAVVTGRARLDAIVGGELHTNDLRYTNVWIREGKAWRLVAWHSSKIS